MSSYFCLLAAAATARPQPAVSPPTLTRIEQTIADVDPLRTSSRTLGVDLRVPTGFGDVYRLDTAYTPGGTGGAGAVGWPRDGFFARVSGAVYAVFPRSVYNQTRRGVLPDIPPGTVFYLGAMPTAPLDAPTPHAPNYLDLRADTRVPTLPANDAPSTQAAIPARPIPRGIMTDEPFRRDTVRALLLSAAKSDAG